MLSLLTDPILEKKCNEKNIGDENLLLDQNIPPVVKDKKKAIQDDASSDIEPYGNPVNGNSYPCSTKIKDGELGGYVEIKESSCTFCDDLCQAP